MQPYPGDELHSLSELASGRAVQGTGQRCKGRGAARPRHRWVAVTALLLPVPPAPGVHSAGTVVAGGCRPPPRHKAAWGISPARGGGPTDRLLKHPAPLCSSPTIPRSVISSI